MNYCRVGNIHRKTFRYETAKPRDYVVGAMVDEAINCWPFSRVHAHKWGGHSHREDPKTSRWRASYVTFERCRDMPGIWKYRGHCFRGETVERGQDPVCC